MGLDMYAYTCNQTLIAEKEIDIDLSLFEESKDVLEELAYWRKFNSLHGWMENLYRAKGGTEEFNLVAIRLCLYDINKLELDAINFKLEPKHGFFFGNLREFTAEDRDEVLSFVEKAKRAISSELAVIYQSWW